MLVALVWTGCSMLDVLLSSLAMNATSAQLGIEAVERLNVEARQLRRAEQRLDVSFVLRPVATDCLRVRVQHREVPRHQLRDRCTRLGISLLIDLAEKPGARLICFPLLARAGAIPT
ncbi:hypothetical protein OG555_27510 [Kribbella sp. NBC_01484]|uniref:hypothetical protein n=1 Tax=Kribbella sp. NBC_01484 TaxID=2903579 RepID=UPI002E3223F9|nr:hypothetical protein [Kribbella sp. NBC_01484]